MVADCLEKELMKRKHRTILALMAVIITVSVLWYSNQPEIPKDASWDDVVAEAESGGYRLISTEELREQYQSKPDMMLLVDTRQEWEYRSGHIKGPVFAPLSGSGQGPESQG